jgi:cadmium resistance protein CadD (predicted permease)
LVGWLLAARLSVGKIFAGYFLGMSCVLAASITIGLAGNLIPVEYLRYLGAIPITLGLKMLFDLWRERGRDGAADASPGMQSAAVGGIFLTQLSNGTDSVLVFAPLLADSSMNIDFMIAVAFMLMVFVWFALAQYATTHAKRISVLTTVAQWVAPIVMIVVGWYIFDNTVTDMVPGS